MKQRSPYAPTDSKCGVHSFYGNPFSQLIAVTNIIVYIAKQLFIEEVYYTDTEPTAVTPESLLSPTIDQLALNKGHLTQDLTPQVPNIALSELNNLCEAIPWENHRSPLEQKLLNDPGFTDQVRSPILKGARAHAYQVLKITRFLQANPRPINF